MVAMNVSFPDWIQGFIIPQKEKEGFWRRKKKKRRRKKVTVSRCDVIEKENKKLKQKIQGSAKVNPFRKIIEDMKRKVAAAAAARKNKINVCERDKQTLRDQNREQMNQLIALENEKRLMMAEKHRTDLIDNGVDLINAGGVENFAVQFTNPSPDIENKVMQDLYNNVVGVGEGAVTTKWSEDENYKTMAVKDYDSFHTDVSGVFREKRAEIQRDIETLKLHLKQYGSTVPMHKWITDNSGNVTRTIEDMNKDVETNQRRTEYETQVVDASQTWRYVVTAIFAIATCVYVFYKGMVLAQYFSWGGLWSMIWRVMLMGGYLYYIEYVIFFIWTLFRSAIQYMRQLLQL